MEANALRDIGERLIELAKNEGATDAIVTVSSGLEKSVSVRNGILASSPISQSAQFSLTAIIGERRGQVEYSSFAPDDLVLGAKRAVSLARVATKNPHLRLSTKSEWPCTMSALPDTILLLDTCDSGEPPTLVELKERALRLDSIARSMRGIARSEETECGYSVGTHVLMMSNGFCGIETYTHHQKSTSVIAEQDGLMKTESEEHAAFHFSDLRSDEECARRAGEYAVSQLGAKPIATAKMPVIFDKRISRRLLSPLIEGISGSNVYHKSTFLLNKLHERIFREGVMIVEEPHRQRRLGSQLYDDEGVKSTSWTLVRNGVLTMWTTTIESASKLKISPTGHASGPSNLSLRASRISRDDMIKDISRGLLVTGIMGSGTNIATGDYSVGVEGFLIENGIITHPVNKVTIAGNLIDMYRELIPANDPSDHSSGANAPSCFIPSMMVGGC